MTVTAYIGTVAAFCTTVAFVPQIVKLRKQGGKDLSYQMLFLYLSGVLLWLVYGIRVHAVAVIWANALSVVMVLISIILKANPPAREFKSGSRGLATQASVGIWDRTTAAHCCRYGRSDRRQFRQAVKYLQPAYWSEVDSGSCSQQRAGFGDSA